MVIGNWNIWEEKAKRQLAITKVKTCNVLMRFSMSFLSIGQEEKYLNCIKREGKRIKSYWPLKWKTYFIILKEGLRGKEWFSWLGYNAGGYVWGATLQEKYLNS